MFAVVEFQEGPLGLSLDDRLVVRTVRPDGQAARGGVQVGDRVIRVQGKEVEELGPTDALERLQSGDRPMQLEFDRAEEEVRPRLSSAASIMIPHSYGTYARIFSKYLMFDTGGGSFNCWFSLEPEGGGAAECFRGFLPWRLIVHVAVGPTGFS